MRLSKGWGAVCVIMLLLLLDQVLKIWIKTHLQLHESIEITPWFYLYFTENPGMAFGIEVIGKLFLSLFRMVAVGFIGYYLYKLVKANQSFGFITCVAMILAGAVGNIIDSVFYGVVFDHSYGQVATFLPPEGGYDTWLHGKVVDMFYFPLIHNAEGEVIFFRPVFNLADSFITCAVIVILIFYHRDLNDSLEKKQTTEK